MWLNNTILVESELDVKIRWKVGWNIVLCDCIFNEDLFFKIKKVKIYL